MVKSPIIDLAEKGGELPVSITMMQVCFAVRCGPFAQGVSMSRVLIVPSNLATMAPLRWAMEFVSARDFSMPSS